MDFVTPHDIERRFAHAKDHQAVEIAYMAPIPTNKIFKQFLREKGYGDQKIVKISRTHAITNCKYSELPYVQAENSERDAAIAAGEARPRREATKYNTIIPNILQEKDGTYYFLTYPREGSKTEPGKLYCVLDENDEIIAQYDTIDPLVDFIQPSYMKPPVDRNTGEYKPNPILRYRVDRMYEVWPE